MDEMKNNFPEPGDGDAAESPIEPFSAPEHDEPSAEFPNVFTQAEPFVGTESDNALVDHDMPVSDNEYQPHETYQPPAQQGNGYVYYPQGYSAPQNYFAPPVKHAESNYAGYNVGGAPVVPPQPSAEKDSYNMYETNRKGRKIFLIVLAVVVAISAIAIPIALSGKLNFDTEAQETEMASDMPTLNENAPSFDINNTPDSGNTNSVGGVLTPVQIYEKIAGSNVAVMVYEDNQLYTEGTGIVMKEDDAGEYTYILTCAHVISDSGVEIAIQMQDGTRYDAEMVGYDLRTDIGIVKIKATGLKVAEFGDSDALKVGSKVYAIGNPGGSALFGTFTDGMVSAIGRSITSSIGYDMVCIQHNAAISPGNSGGALVNEYGQVIGINSSKIAATDFEGISFSIPITQAKDIINKIMVNGYVPGRPKLGISYVENDSAEISSIYSMAVQMMGLPSGSLVIYTIQDDSDLLNTDVKPGDMITAVNGKDLDTADVLLELIENSKVGDELELSIFRIESVGGRYTTEEFTVKVKLIEEKNTNINE